jgi:hypothetical protein
MTAASDIVQAVGNEPGARPYFDAVISAFTTGSRPAAGSAFRLRQAVLALRHRAPTRLGFPDVLSRGLALPNGDHGDAPSRLSNSNRKDILDIEANL